MRYRLLGRSGLLVSEICLGTMTYGGKGRWQPIGQLTLAEVEAQLKMAFDSGVNFIDTANVYSEGDSEALLGQALKNLRLPREELVIATKGGIHWENRIQQKDARPETLLRECDESLRRLQTDRIELYYLHAPDPNVPVAESAGAIA